MSNFLSSLGSVLSGFGAGVQNPAFSFEEARKNRELEGRRQLGNIFSLQSIPAFARPGGAEPDSPENIRNIQLQQMAQVGTPEALEMLGKLSPMNQSPEKMKALGMLSSVISQKYGLPEEQVNAMLMGGVDASTLGSLYKKEPVDLVQTYDPATGQMVYTPKSQAAGRVATAPTVKDRKIIEQGDIQYYADTGEPVISADKLPKPVMPVIPTYLPQNVPDPTARFTDKAKAQIEFSKQAEDKIKTLEEPLEKERTTMARLNRFSELLAIQPTGASEWAPFYTDPELKEMKSIQSEIAPQMRAPGSGSSSDTDVKMFKEATVSPTNPVQTNKNIITARLAAAQNKLDQVEFFREYQAAYGHTKGAEKSWNEYLNANPIFDAKASAKDIILNEKRLPYQAYFAAKNLGITEEDAAAELKRRGKL